MSDHIPPADPAAQELRPIDRNLLDLATTRARTNPRRRALLRYHEFPEPVQRMLNALEPDSYARPHRHVTPPKVEVFLVLRGRAIVVRFDDSGAILEAPEIAAGGPRHGVEVPPGVWHMALALEPDTVFYEVKEGPYDPARDKSFAPWSPPEDDAVAGRRYLEGIRRALHLPPLVAHLPDPATLDDEEDDLF
jgi:cupin fold WbuC family metalloprotein